ncbi:MAG: hypothetical protein ETSY1_29880 [Candidatus Entotheonella factor]|uniref:Uncharacterized protein n=1 Tax=Entotheonella factor TaxID=1429438 RepID=W4LBY8_ENTF1|nr:MAG: hypothetical protein ETSY1_29880 [Candidatus Entotheonella factor]
MDLRRLPSELEQFVQQEVADGKYKSAEDVVGAALRLLRKHDAESRNGGSSSKHDPNPTSRSADEVIQTISEALATGQNGLARQLAMDGARQYPSHAQLQTYARILAPPVMKSVPSTPKSRAAVKANGIWLKAHRQEYMGQWVALREGALLRVADSYEALVADLGDTTDILLTKIV